MILTDTFNPAERGWPVVTTETSSASYIDGAYQLLLQGTNAIRFAYPIELTHHELQVDVSVEIGAAGVIFLSANPVTSYEFLIRSDGKYIIQRVDENIPTKVIPWTDAEALQRGPGATNQLRIARQGMNILFFANDQLLTNFRVRSPELTSSYGFALSSGDSRGQARFDNLIVRRLPEQ
ncbi:MAG: hypothetical protein CYG59_02655 [Chloroflexi bacterium]|nr:MAG: hypothetical protein CYG59_02655 [Chloroflexota bacterium]